MTHSEHSVDNGPRAAAMLRLTMRTVIPAALGLLFLPAGAPAAFLVENGRSDYVIVLPADAIPAEQRAARELQFFLKEISGAELPIRTDRDPLSSRTILLGTADTNRAVRRLPDGPTSAGLGAEGFVVRPVGEHLVLGGGRPRGTLYAVSSFLEDDLGCRWFSATVSRIPRKPTIALPEKGRTETPAFEYREPFYTEAWDRDWAARNRCNGTWMELDEETGGRIAYHPWAHSFDKLVPPEEWFESHPEYFSEIDGRRRADKAQLCLTNPDVLRLSIDRVHRWIERNPGVRMVSVSQNDHYGPCTCAGCRRITEAEGSHAGELLMFVNRIAEAVAERHPDILIDTLAYQYTEKPPKTVRPRENVRVRLAPISNCFSHPIDQCPENRAAYENLKAWSALTDNLYIWHYNTNFAHYPAPLPDLDELQGTTRVYRDLGVKGIFFQGAYARGGGGELAELRSWVLAKMLWNPDRDIWALTEEFARGYYEEAAPHIMLYLRMMHDTVRTENLHARIYDNPEKVPYLRRWLMKRAEEFFEQAEAAVAAKPEVLERVRKARLSVEYVRLLTARSRRERERYEEVVRGKIARYGIQQVREGRPVSEFLESLKGR